MAKRPASAWTAKKIRELRDRLDLTQAEAATRIGVSTRTWIAWENSQTKPSTAAARLLSLLGAGKLPN